MTNVPSVLSGEPTRSSEQPVDTARLAARLYRLLPSIRHHMTIKDIQQDCEALCLKCAAEYESPRWLYMAVLSNLRHRYTRLIAKHKSTTLTETLDYRESKPVDPAIALDVREALDRLSPKQRAVAYDVLILGKSTHAVAAERGVSQPSIHDTLVRAKKHLRTFLAEYDR